MAEDAVESGDLDALNKLLAYSSQTDKKLIETITFEKNRLLQLASQKGHLDIMNRLLQFPEVESHAADEGNTALYNAIRDGNLAIVNRLIKIPSVFEEMKSQAHKAQIFAVQSGKLEMLNLILNFPDILEQLETNFYNLLDFAFDMKYFDIAKRLLEFPIIQMRQAASQGKLEELKQLIENRATLNDSTLFTLLLLATRNGHLNIVNYLLQFSGFKDSMLINNKIQRLLSGAISSRNLALVNRLLEIPGALKKAKDSFKYFISYNVQDLNILNRFLEIKDIVDLVVSSDEIINSAAESYSASSIILERLLQIPGVKERCTITTVDQACRSGSVDKLNRLLEIPHIIEAIKKEGANNALHMSRNSAITSRLFEIPEVLEMLKKTMFVPTALHYAIDGNDLGLLNRVLQEFPPSQIADLLKRESEINNYALKKAVDHGNLAILNRLLKVDSIRERFIYTTVRAVHMEQLEELLERLPTLNTMKEQFISDEPFITTQGTLKPFHQGALKTAVSDLNLPMVYRLCEVLLEYGVALPSKLSLSIGGVSEPLKTFNSKIDSIIVTMSFLLSPRTSLEMGIMSLILQYAALPEGKLRDLCSLKGVSIAPASALPLTSEQQPATLMFSKSEIPTPLSLEVRAEQAIPCAAESEETSRSFPGVIAFATVHSDEKKSVEKSVEKKHFR